MPAIHLVIPCKPMVYQYLMNKYQGVAVPAMAGNLPHMLVELPGRDPNLLLLYTLLQRATRHQDTKYTLQHYTRQVHIPISYETYERYGMDLSKEAIAAFNNRIVDTIFDRLEMIIEFYTSIGFQRKDAVQIFRRAYNFPEDSYTTDAIEKYWQRKPNKNQISIHKIVGETVLRKNQYKNAHR